MANGVYNLSLFIRFFALAGQVGGPGCARPTFFRSLPLTGFPGASHQYQFTDQKYKFRIAAGTRIGFGFV